MPSRGVPLEQHERWISNGMSGRKLADSIPNDIHDQHQSQDRSLGHFTLRIRASDSRPPPIPSPEIGRGVAIVESIMK